MDDMPFVIINGRKYFSADAVAATLLAASSERESIERAGREQATRADDNRAWALRVEGEREQMADAVRLAREFIANLSKVGGQAAEERRILETIDKVLPPVRADDEPNEPEPSVHFNLDLPPAGGRG